MPKVQPAERIVNLGIPAGEIGVVDSAWLLSQINRKAYRQGYEYAIDYVEVIQNDPTVEGNCDIYRLPHTWVTCNSWVKGFSHWKAQQDEAARESGNQSTKGKYNDFKICYNLYQCTGDYHGTAVSTLAPLGPFLTEAEAQAIDPDALMEWDYSEVAVPNVTTQGNTVEYTLHMLGMDSGVRKGLIKAYAESRARPHNVDPSMVTQSGGNIQGGLYAEMVDVGSMMDEVVTNLRERNDSPPYVVGGIDSPFQFYPGGWEDGTVGAQGTHFDRLIVRTGSTISSDATGPFTALCGLLWIRNNTEATLTIRIRYAVGAYNGVAARPMMEVN